MESLILLFVLIGAALFCAGLGIAIKVFKKYHWINGLDTAAMSEAELEKVGTFTAFSLGILAFFLVLMATFGYFNHSLAFIIVAFFMLAFTAVITTISYASGYGWHKKIGWSIGRFRPRPASFPRRKPSLLKVILFAATAFLCCLAFGVFLLWGVQDNSVVLDGAALKISGMYGKTYPLKQIENVELQETMDWSAIKTRYNGTSIGEIRKGIFEVTGIGRTRLFISSSKGPYLILKIQGENPVIIARSDPEETRRLYRELLNFLSF